MCWQDMEDGVTCGPLYKHDRRVTSIAGLDMDRYTMCWQDIEDGVTCDLLYKHDRRVTSIAGLDMGRYIRASS